MANSIKKNKILIAVSGSISAYRIADVVSELKKRDFEVRCILTQSASQFVSPLVLETLSGNPVLNHLWGADISGTEHITLARWPDLIVFAPATAHLIARLALGLADDLVTTVALASRAPFLIAPAMNTVMWENPVTQNHVATLSARGVHWIAPDEGELACGEIGAGKLAQPLAIVSEIVARLDAQDLSTAPQDLKGKKILITAGPTLSRIDAVRYMTNGSTGKMGAALAEEALTRGAEVYYVLGVDKGVVRPQVSAQLREKFHLKEISTAEEMRDAALTWLPLVDGIIATAAVLDYRVAQPAVGKLKRTSEPMTLALEPSVDVLDTLRSLARPDQWFFGFAAETESLETHARAKMTKKRLNFVFANEVSKSFGENSNEGIFLSQTGEPQILGPTSKRKLASQLWDQITHA